MWFCGKHRGDRAIRHWAPLANTSGKAKQSEGEHLFDWSRGHSDSMPNLKLGLQRAEVDCLSVAEGPSWQCGYSRLSPQISDLGGQGRQNLRGKDIWRRNMASEDPVALLGASFEWLLLHWVTLRLSDPWFRHTWWAAATERKFERSELANRNPAVGFSKQFRKSELRPLSWTALP